MQSLHYNTPYTSVLFYDAKYFLLILSCNLYPLYKVRYADRNDIHHLSRKQITLSSRDINDKWQEIHM